MERIIRLIIFALSIFVILKLTTFGWNFFSPSNLNLKPKEKNLAENLKNHVYKISGQIGDRNIFNYQNLEKTAEYIEAKFNDYGYKAEFQEYIVEGKKVRNIIAIKKGIRFPDQFILVGAHYDSCLNPGADDNASGVSGLLELSRLLANKDTNYTLKFITFVNEEPPFFKTKDMGSYVYAREARANSEKIKVAIILESIGYYTNRISSQRYPLFMGFFYPNRGNFITLVGNFKSSRLVKELKRYFKRSSKFPISSTCLGFLPAADFSDHWAFWRAGYPALMITDTAFLRNPDYHGLDTWEKLDYESCACVVEGFYQALLKLSQ